MAEIITIPVRKRLRENVRIVLVREVTDNLTAKVGDEVTPETILGSLKKRRELTKSFPGVKLKIVPGAKVESGRPIGETSGLFGLGKSQILAGIDGMVKSVNLKTNEVIFEEQLGEEKVASGCWGRVSAIAASQVEIEAVATEYFGVIGAGPVREGFIRTFVKPDEIIMPAQLDRKAAESILSGGSLLLPETVEKAQALGAVGAVTGGVHFKDFQEFEKNSQEFPIIIFEGFGAIPFGAQIPEAYAIINGREAKITVPKKGKVTGIKNPEQPERARLEKNLFVRIVALDNLGKYGKVINIGEKREILPSGISDFIAEVLIGEEKLRVAASNLEAIL